MRALTEGLIIIVCVGLYYALSGAAFLAKTAVNAFIVIDIGKEVFHRYGALGALFGTQPAADTARLANLACFGALVGVFTADRGLCKGSYLDDRIGTFLGAKTAADAFFVGYTGNSV